ncbi:MAG: tRNA uridine-5-carboxymethylaminomethyl(34) synthesis GTPase MnmE [Desulfobacterales bacterium]
MPKKELCKIPKKNEKSNRLACLDLGTYFEDTIAAIATPAGKAGIGIIRISGNQAVSIGKKIFRPNGSSHYIKIGFECHRIYYGKIIDPADQKIIDEVIVLPMIAPRSYTREDIIEIHAHSGSAVLEKILNIVLQQHARIAEPGEFTKRAFLNGRIDLTQAEAIIDMINAETESARKIALSQLEGGLRNQLIAIKTCILQSLAEIEAQIEFAEDQGEDFLNQKFLDENIYQPLRRLEKSAEIGKILKEGIRVALAGKPNVGKSSIMNRLLCQERSIVTPFSGTTRDHIEECFDIQGVKIRLIDTAGIRKSKNPVEVIGIKKSKAMIQNADLILMVCDLSVSITQEDLEIFDKIRKKKKILVFNKNDMVKYQDFEKLPAEWKNEKIVVISALKNDGIDKLKDAMVFKLIDQKSSEKNDILISNIRQKQNIEKAIKAIDNAKKCYEHNGFLEIAAIEFQEAKKQIDQALGVDVSEDILEQVFKNFCIGK